MSVAGAALFFEGWGPESPWYRTAIGTMLWAMQYYVFVAEFFLAGIFLKTEISS